MRSFALHLAVAVVAGWLLPVAESGAEMGGGEGRPTHFAGFVRLPDGECRLSIDIERVSFLVTSVAGKYRFVRMHVACEGGSLALSSSDDRLEMVVPGAPPRQVVGVLSLRRSDSTLWDAFDADMRRTLSYPPEVKADEPVYVFAYFPAEEANELPDAFGFTIASLDEIVWLTNLVAAARN